MRIYTIIACVCLVGGLKAAAHAAPARPCPDKTLCIIDVNGMKQCHTYHGVCSKVGEMKTETTDGKVTTQRVRLK